MFDVVDFLYAATRAYPSYFRAGVEVGLHAADCANGEASRAVPVKFNDMISRMQRRALHLPPLTYARITLNFHHRRYPP